MGSSAYEELEDYDVSLIADALDACGHPNQVLSSSLRPLACTPGKTLVGQARPIKYRGLPPEKQLPPVDHDKKIAGLQKLESQFSPGDILVMAVDKTVQAAPPECGVVGNLFANLYKNLGLKSLVIEGFVRDIDQLPAFGLPIYAVGTSPRNGAGRIAPTGLNQPVSISDVTINPDDLLAMNGDGIVVIPNDDELVERLLLWLREKVENERGTAEALAKGGLLSEAYKTFGQV
jgi:regulator of RNase E activity RraA